MSLKDVAKSALGLVEKAKLIVHETTGTEKLDSRQVGAVTTTILSAAASGLGSSFGKFGVQSYELVVQYNPSSLTIQANAEAIPFKYLQQNVDNGIPNQNLRPPMVVLSVELLFDDMNPQDAFLMDRTRLSAGSVISDVAGAVKTAQGGYTVQPRTNGLLATVLRPNTKIVTFSWADMSFTGQVIEAEAQYTMFSPSGKPIRSVVCLNIAQQVESDSEAGYWDKAINDTFKDGTFTGKGMDQMVGNLLNLDAF